MQQLVIKNGFVIVTHSLDQNLRGVYPGSEIILWDKPIPEPVEGEILQRDPRTDQEKRNNYADLRRTAYPTIEDQLDMMFQDQVNGTTKWMETIQEIKGQYPKPATK